MSAPELQTLARLFTERLLNTAVEGMILAGLVWLLSRLLRRQNAGTRFAVWFSALLGIVALPFFAASALRATPSTFLVPANLHGEITLSGRWALFLFALWAAGASLMLVRLAVGLWRVHQVRNHCSDVGLSNLDPAIAQIFCDFGSGHRVQLCVSSDVAVPAALGFFRPAIVFPARLLPQLSVREIEVVLLHELAHLRRWDHWTNLAQQTVKALFFFHPAVWWIDNRLALEREIACDDMVLEQTASPRAYASALISFAEKMQSARGLALAQTLVNKMRQMSLRLAQILDAERPSRTGFWNPALGVSAGLLVLALCAAPYVPELVAFQNQPSQNHLRPIQVVQQEAQPKVADGTGDSSLLPVMPTLAHAPQPRAIPAAFNPNQASHQRSSRATQRHKPVVMRAKRKTEKTASSQETLVILQTTGYDASGFKVLRLSIWRVENGNFAERQLESAIVLRI